MAEKIVSPGVFTRENDLSFLQQGVSEIGAAFIGPFLEGPIVPTIVNSQAEFETLFGKADGTYYTPLAVQNYLREAGTATICRVAGVDGYAEKNPMILYVSSSAGLTGSAILFNTDTDSTGFSGAYSILDGNDGTGTFIISGSELAFNGTASLDSNSPNNVENVFGTSPFGTNGAYVYGYFKNNGVAFAAGVDVSASVLGDQDFAISAQEATTPYIISQTISGQNQQLFQFETIGVGNVANTKVKIGISNIKPAGAVAGTDYGTFTVTVRAYDDTNKKKVVLETFSNVNLDPNSPNFISRVIGDRKLSISSEGKISEIGDWVNNSKYIRVNSETFNANAPVQAVPYGHAAYVTPVSGSTTQVALIPAVTYATASATSFGGIDLDGNTDNKIYNKPTPQNWEGTGLNSKYTLENDSVSLSNSADLSKRNFVVSFQSGFDGMSPATPINKGTDISDSNSQGFDLRTSVSKGSEAYMKAVNALSNADEFDINMVVAPGINRADHSYVWTSILDMVEQRGDAFFIADAGNAGTPLTATITQAESVDSNYAAVYYPWVKTIDINTNKLITVPPSVLLPGVFAANDRVAAEWFAPAGLNRGGLVGAVSVLNRLTQSERDTLYEGKVNPIAQFPGQGIVVFGQKTLQDKPSALDRINVRRLLLSVRKYIASTSRFLVFEQNTSETRNRFLNIVNPYLESIQQRQGLYAFRVVMDETNNTPDVIDRNIMQGSIFLQPTKTAEFIQIDFNILPTGAAFNG
jgi:hypothetical protein